MDLREQVRSDILKFFSEKFKIYEKDINDEQNLYGTEIDSFEFLTLIVGLEEICQAHSLKVDVEELVADGDISIKNLLNRIFQNNSFS